MTSHAVKIAGPYTMPVDAGIAVTALHIVKLNAGSDGVIHTITGTDLALGQSENDMPAAAADRPRGNTITICPFDGAGTRRFVVSGVVAIGVQIGQSTAGKVIAGTDLPYISLEASLADGDIIECAPIIKPDLLV